jgi:hypothetical protein
VVVSLRLPSFEPLADVQAANIFDGACDIAEALCADPDIVAFALNYQAVAFCYGQVESYETFLSPEQKRDAHRFFASKIDQQEILTNRNAPSTRTSDTLFDVPVQDDGLTERLRNGKRCAKIIEEMKLIKRAHSTRGLTITQSKEMHKEFEVWAVAATHLNGEDLETFNHPKQWGPTVAYACLLLSKEYGNKHHTTIYDWVKDYRRYQKGIE